MTYLNSPNTRSVTVLWLKPHSLEEAHVYSPPMAAPGQLLTTNDAGAGPDGVLITGGEFLPPLAAQWNRMVSPRNGHALTLRGGQRSLEHPLPAPNVLTLK